LDNFKQNVIKDIVQELDCGFDCYYNSKTGEIIGIPNFSKFINEEDFKAVFCDSLEKIENNKSDFIKFEALKSFESFRIMERFADQVADLKIKAELEYVLTNKKPFKNFKHKIDTSELRQNWFEFKQDELGKMVEKQLANERSSSQQRRE